jgi:hypothetical protein
VAIIATLTPVQVLELRRTFARMHAGTPEHDMMLEIVDGHLALRGINLPDM